MTRCALRRKIESVRAPSFSIVGVGRCGTEPLARYPTKRSQLFFATHKEHFCAYSRDERADDVDASDDAPADGNVPDDASDDASAEPSEDDNADDAPGDANAG